MPDDSLDQNFKRDWKAYKTAFARIGLKFGAPSIDELKADLKTQDQPIMENLNLVLLKQNQLILDNHMLLLAKRFDVDLNILKERFSYLRERYSPELFCGLGQYNARNTIKYYIEISFGLTNILFNAVKVYATRIKFPNQDGTWETASIPIAEQKKYTDALVKSFFDPTEKYPIIIESHRFPPEFLLVITLVYYFVLKFILGHEMGHFMLEIFPEKVENYYSERNFSKSIVDHLPKQNCPIDLLQKLEEQWGKEFNADLVGFDLLLNADPAPVPRDYVYVELAVQIFFNTFDLLAFYKRHILGEMRFIPSHPETKTRLKVLSLSLKSIKNSEKVQFQGITSQIFEELKINLFIKKVESYLESNPRDLLVQLGKMSIIREFYLNMKVAERLFETSMPEEYFQAGLFLNEVGKLLFDLLNDFFAQSTNEISLRTVIQGAFLQLMQRFERKSLTTAFRDGQKYIIFENLGIDLPQFIALLLKVGILDFFINYFKERRSLFLDGVKAIENGDYEQGVKKFHAILLQFGFDIQTFVNYGLCSLSLGNIEQGLNVLRIGLHKYPVYMNALVPLANFSANSEERKMCLKWAFYVASKNSPHLPAIFYIVGITFFEKQEYFKSKTYLLKALISNTEERRRNLKILYYLIKIFDHENKINEVVHFGNRYIALCNKEEERSQESNEIEQLLSRYKNPS